MNTSFVVKLCVNKYEYIYKILGIIEAYVTQFYGLMQSCSYSLGHYFMALGNKLDVVSIQENDFVYWFGIAHSVNHLFMVFTFH